MKANEQLQSEASGEMSTIVVVKNRCQFCYAFFKVPDKIVEHSQRCEFRFSETFEATDGKVKFACAVCFDVFPTQAAHRTHERLHKFPGGFPCSVCTKIFLNDLECGQHMENAHEVLPTDCSAFTCFDCGACFQQKSYLRLHCETNCGRHRSWNCIQCNLLTADAYKEHMIVQHKTAFEEENAVVESKVDVTLIEEEIEIRARTDIIDDPLRLVLKEEEMTPSIMEANAEYVSKTTSRISPMKKTKPQRDSIEIPSVGINAGSDFKSDRRCITQPQFACNYCSNKYFDKNWLETHIKKHGPDGSLRYKCECCPKYFGTSEDRMEHTETVHRERTICKICDKSFRMVISLRAHYKTDHEEIKDLVCLCCNAEFANRKSFEIHEQTGCGSDSESSAGSISSDGSISDDESISIESFNNSNDRISATSDTKPNRRARAEKKLDCLYCGQKYATERSLSKHIVDHGPDGSLVHRCNSCPKYFETTEVRDSHSMTEHSEKIMCKICGKSFQNQLRLEIHNRSIHKRRKNSDKKYKCKYCHMKYSTQKGLNNHVADHGPDGSLLYRCDFFCPIFFKTKEERLAHKIATHKERLTCPVCGKLCLRTGGLHACLRAHRKGSTKKGTTKKGPTKKEAIVCIKCGKSFTARSYLEIHEKSDCGRSPIYKCEECGKNVACKGSLKAHMKIHIGDRNFSCNFCDKKFFSNTNLKLHTRTHTGEKPFKCDYCEKRFVDISSKKLHSAVHTGIKRYVCYGCGERFPSNSAVHKHRNTRKDTCALVPIRPPLGTGDLLLESILAGSEKKS